MDQFGRWANWFSDPDLFDCPECEDPGRSYAAAAAAESYRRGYDQGKDKACFELQVHQPGEHLAGCGCRPCLAVQDMAEKLLYHWAYAVALEQAAQDEDIARAAVAAASLDAARPGPSIHRAGLLAKERPMQSNEATQGQWRAYGCQRSGLGEAVGLAGLELRDIR